MGPRKHVLDGVHIGATWRIRLNRQCAAVMRPSQITLTNVVVVVVVCCLLLLLLLVSLIIYAMLSDVNPHYL